MENWVNYALELMGGTQDNLDPLVLAYFFTYILIVAYVLTSVVMAVLVENFSKASQDENHKAVSDSYRGSQTRIISADSPLDPILRDLALVDSTHELDHCTFPPIFLSSGHSCKANTLTWLLFLFRSGRLL